MNHKDKRQEDVQIEYSFVDLSVNSDGTMEGTVKGVCYGVNQFGVMRCDQGTSLWHYGAKVTRSADGRLTFHWNDGGSRYFNKINSVPTSADAWAANGAPELQPFIR